MGRRKGSKTKSKKQNNFYNQFKKDIAIVAMIVLSIILMAIIYFNTNTGIVGEFLSPILGGLFGSVKYLIPIGTFIMAIAIAKDTKPCVFARLTQYAIFLACIASLLTIYQFSKGNINTNLEFDKLMQVAYDLGIKNVGGGAIGAFIASPLSTFLGNFGAAIISIGVAFVLFIFTFGIRPSEIINSISDKMQESKEELKEQYEEEVSRKEANRLKVKDDKETANRKSSGKLKLVVNNDEPEEVEKEEQIQFNLNQEEEPEKKKASKFAKLFGIEKEEKEANPNEIEANLFKNKTNKVENTPKVQEDALFKTEEETKESKVKQVLQLDHNTTTVDDENYEFPPFNLMQQGDNKGQKGGKKALVDTATKLQKTLYSFGVSAKVENYSVGPAITRYELKPAEGVRVSKIAKLSDDIALNLAAESIRIEAPIPGKQAVGIEIPNKEKEVVHLRDIIESSDFGDAKSKLAFALGKDVAGEVVVTDIAKMPHVLIAGATGSGKSVCINTLITSIIYKAKPSEVKLVMIDPKVVELSVYNGIPHLLIPVVTDPKKAAGALQWAVQEMVNRYSLFAEKGVRDIKGYNEVMSNEETGKLPQIVIIIDELADLMMVSPKDVEDSICRLAQMARAAGMHLVIATQRPSVDVITGIIKANIPSRIAFSVSSQVDSRTILDMVGAEKLLGKGDMLFYPIGAPKPIRVQGAFVSDKEVEKIVDFLKANGEVKYNEDIIEKIEKNNTTDREKDEEKDDVDPILNDAIELAIANQQISTTRIQSRFSVGYARATKIIDEMEYRGIISGSKGSKPRDVLISKERWEELKMEKPPQENEE